MIIDKVIYTYQKEGFRTLLKKVAKKITGTPTGDHSEKIDLTNLPLMPSLNDISGIDYQIPQVKPPKLNKKHLNIVWVIPPVGPGGGGHTTITRFARYLQKQGHLVSFSIYNNNTMLQSNKEAEEVLRKSYNIQTKVKDISELSEEDVIFATSWETAYGVYNIKTKGHKFYFVQDFEPMFFGVGSRYMLAEATYKFGFYGVTAGKWLTEKVKKYGMEADYFDFGVDTEIYRSKKQIVQKEKKKKIAFYARAHTERRGFELGILALKMFKEKHPEFEIVFFGQDVSNYEIPFEYTNSGILTPAELSKLYQESIACLVLSLTNVSLLPLELLAAGCVPVMNGGENNTIVLDGVEGIAYTEAFPPNLARKLCQIVEANNIEENAQKISENIKNKSWDKSYEKVEKIILREVTINE